VCVCIFINFIELYKKNEKEKETKNVCLYLFQGSFYDETANE